MTAVTDETADAGSKPADVVGEQLARQLVEQARTQGVDLVGPDGLLRRVTKLVLEGALEGELTGHLGYGRHDQAGKDGGNSRNGTRSKTVLTDVGPVEIDVPRDRDSSFSPKIVRKRQRRLTGVEDMVISLVAKGLTTGEVQAHLAEIYGAEVSRQTISTITDKVLDGLSEWQNRPPDPVYAVLFVDAIQVKIRDGQVANRPIYVVLGVTVDGERDILGLWAGDGGEGAKYWMHVLTEIKNRGTRDVCIVVCDGLTGLPDAISTVWPKAVTQTCIVHLLRNSFRYASRKDWTAIARDLKPVYTAATEQAALDRFAEFCATWEARYPAIVRLWTNAWAEFVPFLAFDIEIRTVISTTNHRKPQRPLPPLGQGPRTLPVRTGRAQTPLPGRRQPRPDRPRPATLDQPVESRVERLRHHLRRPPLSRPQITPHRSQLHRKLDSPFSCGLAGMCGQPPSLSVRCGLADVCGG
jgi:transposase-like protein